MPCVLSATRFLGLALSASKQSNFRAAERSMQRYALRNRSGELFGNVVATTDLARHTPGPLRCSEDCDEPLIKLVGREGVEPSTKRLRVSCSTN